MTIAEVSRKYEISADTLRYYERIGLVPPGAPAAKAASGITTRRPAAGSS